MDVRHLRTLIAIANSGSFAAAGEEVGLTQSAVSQQVKAMETEFGVALFNRAARPPSLTGQGRTLVEQARRIVALCDEAAGMLKGDRLSGILYLGVIRGSLMGALPEALSQMRTRYPGLKLRVATGDLIDLVSDVQSGKLDAAMIPDASPFDAGLRWQPFTVEPFLVIAPAGAAGKTDRDLLESAPYIQFSRNVRTGLLIEAELQRRGITVATEMEIDSFSAVVLMVKQGLGCSIVPRQAISYLPEGSVRALPFGTPPVSRTIGMVESTASLKASLVAALLAELRRASDGVDVSRAAAE
jgi:DNA-binding transcriptional LysR family regulator